MKYKLLCWLNEFWYTRLRLFASKLFAFSSIVVWWLGNKPRSAKLILASLRYGQQRGSLGQLKKVLAQKAAFDRLITRGVCIGEAGARSIIIKWPTYEEGRVVQKGVLIITFTRTLSYFLKSINLESMAEHFVFVLEPSWSGYADADILGFVGRVNNVIVECSEIEDRVLLNSFPDTFVPVSFGASDWVDSNIFNHRALDKQYDSVYIANTNPIKRVKRYLDAIKNIVEKYDSKYVGCLVCASWGGSEELVRDMVSLYNLGENIILKFSLDRDAVIDVLNSSKANILLSYKEGSNRSLFEAMFCDVPVICISENVGVNKSYINEFTGALVFDEELESTLLWMKHNYENYKPRRWALENISPHITTQKLLHILNSRIGNEKRYQLGELLIKTNNPEVSYLDYQYVNHKQYSSLVLELFQTNVNLEFSYCVNRVVQMHMLFEKDLKNPIVS